MSASALTFLTVSIRSLPDKILWLLSCSAWTLGHEALPPFRLFVGGKSDWLGLPGLWSAQFPALAWNPLAFALRPGPQTPLPDSP